jgi:hypothetical protein
MVRIRLLLLMAMSAVLLTACSGRQVKMTIYEALQNKTDQQCKKPGADCPEPMSYEEYEKARKKLLEKETSR